jgi:nucleotide-binding universal stress UspA family protein
MPRLYSRVLVPVDGSEFSMRAVEASARITDVKTGMVTVIMVVEPPVLQTYNPFYDALKSTEQATPTTILPNTLRTKELKEAEEVVQKAKEILMTAGLSAQTKILEGEPSRVIVEEARTGYEIIVLATWGLKGIKKHVLGSVAAKVVQDSPCSVLVVK